MLYEFLDENTVKVRIENPDDLWHLEKIIRKGDIISAKSTRLYKTESGSERKKVYIILKVEKVSFHPYNKSLRILGTIIDGYPEEYIKKGKHHSFDLTEGDEIKIKKEKWLKTDIERLEESKKEIPIVDILYIDDKGSSLYSLTNYNVLFKGNVENPNSGKRYINKDHKRNQQKYLKEIKELISKNEKNPLIVCGPGNIKRDIFNEIKTDRKLYFCDTHNPGKSSVYELIRKKEIDHVIKDFRIAKEEKYLEEILKRISKGDLIAYGHEDIIKNINIGNIDILFLTKDKFLEYDKTLLDKVEKNGGKIFIFENNVDFLKSIGGEVAFLRWEG